MARRAVEFATLDGTVPTLLYVRSPAEDPESGSVERGRAAVDDVARSAGLEPDEYEVEVLARDDVEAAILEAIQEYDTVCIGLSSRTDASGVVYGKITEHVSRMATGNVALIRGS